MQLEARCTKATNFRRGPEALAEKHAPQTRSQSLIEKGIHGLRLCKDRVANGLPALFQPLIWCTPRLFRLFGPATVTGRVTN